MEWEYVERPTEQWLGSSIRQNRGFEDNPDGQPAVHGDKPFTHEQHAATS
jgi:Mn-containing catalase